MTEAHRPGGYPRALKSFPELAEEERHKRFPFLYEPQAAQALYGRDHLGRAYFSERLPWVRRLAPGLVRLDLGLAAQTGVEIARDPSGYVRVRV